MSGSPVSQCSMTIDPKTTVGQLITALPSTMPLLQSYGVSLEQTTDQPLWKVLMDVQVEMDEFLHAVDEIDWSAEFPPRWEARPLNCWRP